MNNQNEAPSKGRISFLSFVIQNIYSLLCYSMLLGGFGVLLRAHIMHSEWLYSLGYIGLPAGVACYFLAVRFLHRNIRSFVYVMAVLLVCASISFVAGAFNGN